VGMVDFFSINKSALRRCLPSAFPLRMCRFDGPLGADAFFPFGAASDGNPCIFMRRVFRFWLVGLGKRLPL
jgi:hypothetical protein